jgi:hypothetical protein
LGEERAGTQVALSISCSRLTLWAAAEVAGTFLLSGHPVDSTAVGPYLVYSESGRGGGTAKRKTEGFPICKIWASCFEVWSFQATLHLISSPSTKWWCIGRSWSWSRSGHGDRWSSNEPAPCPFIPNSIGTLGLAATPAPPPEGSCSFSPTAMIRMSRTARSLHRQRHRAHCSQKP